MNLAPARLACITQQLAKAPLPELQTLLGNLVPTEQALAAPQRHRLFPPSGVFWLFLSQVLSAEKSCGAALAELHRRSGRQQGPVRFDG